MFGFSPGRTFRKNDRTEIQNNRMSGNPVFTQSIVIGVETSKFRRVSEGVYGPQMKVEKCSRMLLSGFVLMDVQERRF